MKVEDININLYYFKIDVIHNGVTIECLHWLGLPYYLRVKYDWYFNYRAALLRVKYPRYRHAIVMGSYQKEIKDLIKIKEIQLKKAITIVTTYEKNLELYRQSYSALFPIEDDPNYKKALQVLDNKRENVNKIKRELNQLNNV